MHLEIRRQRMVKLYRLEESKWEFSLIQFKRQKKVITLLDQKKSGVREDPKINNQRIIPFVSHQKEGKLIHVKDMYVQKSKEKKLLQKQCKQGMCFEDTNFPRNNDSIGFAYQTDLKWMPLISLFESNINIFKQEVSPSDITQESLGDCYFMAGIAALSEYPKRIRRLFITQEINKYKYFQIRILYKGIWRNITLDEFVPVNDKQKPKFGGSKLWVILLQKAWAKLFKSYLNINEGYPYEPLRALTGAPVVDYRLDQIQKNQLFNLITDRNYSMIASSKSCKQTQYNQFNIAMGHAYSLLSTARLQIDNTDYKLLKLRNPWGKGQNNGKFSDNDPIWDKVIPQIKKKIGYVNAEDGQFFITLQDFYKSFHRVTIAKVQDSWSFITCKQRHNFKNGLYFKVKIERAGSYSFQFEQTPFRTFKDKFKYKFNDLTLLVGQVTKQGIKYMQGCFMCSPWVQKTYQLLPGNYIAYVKDNNHNQKEKQNGNYALSIYAEFVCKIQSANKIDCINFLPQYFLNGCLQKDKKQIIKNQSGKRYYFYNVEFEQGYTAFVLLNQQDEPIGLTVKCQSEYLHFKREFKKQSSINIFAEKGKPAIALARKRVSNLRGITVKAIKST